MPRCMVSRGGLVSVVVLAGCLTEAGYARFHRNTYQPPTPPAAPADADPKAVATPVVVGRYLRHLWPKECYRDDRWINANDVMYDAPCLAAVPRHTTVRTLDGRRLAAEKWSQGSTTWLALDGNDDPAVAVWPADAAMTTIAARTDAPPLDERALAGPGYTTFSWVDVDLDGDGAPDHVIDLGAERTQVIVLVPAVGSPTVVSRETYGAVLVGALVIAGHAYVILGRPATPEGDPALWHFADGKLQL
jgi:hypothetical protein